MVVGGSGNGGRDVVRQRGQHAWCATIIARAWRGYCRHRRTWIGCETRAGTRPGGARGRGRCGFWSRLGARGCETSQKTSHLFHVVGQAVAPDLRFLPPLSGARALFPGSFVGRCTQTATNSRTAKKKRRRRPVPATERRVFLFPVRSLQMETTCVCVCVWGHVLWNVRERERERRRAKSAR